MSIWRYGMVLGCALWLGACSGSGKVYDKPVAATGDGANAIGAASGSDGSAALSPDAIMATAGQEDGTVPVKDAGEGSSASDTGSGGPADT